MRTTCKYSCLITPLILTILLLSGNWIKAQTHYGAHDTILCPAVVYEGDTIEAKILAGVYVWGKSNLSAKARWTRLRNAVYVTYPYARRAGIVFNDIEKHIATNTDKNLLLLTLIVVKKN